MEKLVCRGSERCGWVTQGLENRGGILQYLMFWALHRYITCSQPNHDITCIAITITSLAETSQHVQAHVLLVTTGFICAHRDVANGANDEVYEKSPDALLVEGTGDMNAARKRKRKLLHLN